MLEAIRVEIWIPISRLRNYKRETGSAALFKGKRKIWANFNSQSVIKKQKTSVYGGLYLIALKSLD